MLIRCGSTSYYAWPMRGVAGTRFSARKFARGKSFFAFVIDCRYGC